MLLFTFKYDKEREVNHITENYVFICTYRKIIRGPYRRIRLLLHCIACSVVVVVGASGQLGTIIIGRLGHQKVY